MKTILSDPLLQRSRRLLHDHRSRAKRDGAALNYNLDDVRQLLEAHPTCSYCRMPLSFAAYLDHRQPLARGGQHHLDNLAVCCTRCNSVKGQLSEAEYRELLALVTHWHPTARQDLERRLISGATRYACSRRKC
jgi:5-methylcytosine-specific restriction endonuclease McrA